MPWAARTSLKPRKRLSRPQRLVWQPETAQAPVKAAGDLDPLRVADCPDGALLHIAREYTKVHAQVLVLNELPAEAEKAWTRCRTASTR
jgi:hypothetical protein